MSNYKTVFFTLGILQIILGIFIFVPIIIQFLYSEVDSSFFGASIVTIIFGTLFFLSNLNHDKKLTLQQAFLLTALSWFSIALFGSLPFVFSDLNLIKKNNVPKIIVTNEELKKDESSSLYENCAIIGINIKIPSIICRIPSVKKTVL